MPLCGDDGVRTYPPTRRVDQVDRYHGTEDHNVKKGTRYPPTLVTTGDTDERAVPLHSFKFVAVLQPAQAGPAPVLLRVEERGGHGGDKPTAKRIEEVTDQFVFLARNLRMKWAPHHR